MTDAHRIGLDLEEALLLMRILEESVVSIHRVMSRAAEGAQVGHLLEQYFLERNAWPRLSEARRVLAEALDREIGEEGVTELLGEIRYFPDEI